MMDRLAKKMGAASPAPCAPASIGVCPAIYPLPSEYRKPIRFRVKGHVIRLKGGRALTLERLIAAGPAGIDRATTLQWIANLGDTIAALREAGITIATRKGQAANYALGCTVEKIGGAA